MPVARSLSSAQLSSREARWLAIAAQGLSAPRPATTGVRRTAAKTRAQLLGVMDQLGTIQLDAVNVLARTQFLVPFSRLGPYDPAVLRSLSEPQGSWLEYWGHAASLLPVELHPLFRWRMQRWRDDLVDSAAAQERRRAWREAHSAYIAYVLAEVTERGPLAASQLSDPRRQTANGGTVVAPGPVSIPRTKVPAREYYVMGDNRLDSCDSRSFGAVPRSLVVGEVVAILLRGNHPHLKFL